MASRQWLAVPDAAQRGAPAREGWWGYDTLIAEDPDGSEWYFAYPDEVARGQ